MLRTFRKGGIHPPESKLSRNEQIKLLPLPQVVQIPIAQHIGTPAKAVVKRGDQVKVGTLIAEAGSFVSANIHSSVSGTVAKLDEVVDASGFARTVITIQSDGEDTWEECIDRSPELVRECHLTPAEITKRIASNGIVGMGGATFPTSVKLMPPKDTTPELVIINGVECEPYLTADHRLMLEYPEEILVGTSLLMKATGAARGVVAVENNKKDSITLLTSLLPQYPGIEVMPLKVKYPQGGEKQLIDAVMKRQVGSGKLPVTVGAIVQNVGTAFAVYEAVQKNKPLVERVVTVTGKAVATPSNFKVRIGTPTEQLIEAVGGVPDGTAKIVSGGPMMGKALATPNVPVTKGTSGLLLLPQKDTKRKPMRNCIHCAKCVQACPMGLNPAYLMRDVKYNDWDNCETLHIVDCIECGSCSYTCPANRPLLDHIRIGKQKVTSIIRARNN